MPKKHRRCRKLRPRRRPSIEQLETRRLLTISGWHNFLGPENVNGDSVVSPIDVLIIVNELNNPNAGVRKLSIPGPERSTKYGLDVNCDGFIAPNDALAVINAINGNRFSIGWQFSVEGGYVAPARGQNGIGCSPRLVEGNSLVSSLSREFSVPSFPSFAKIDFRELMFDETDAGFVRDAFEIAIVDNDGNPVVDTIAFGRDATFNDTEGIGALFSEATTLVNDSLFVDLTGLPPFLEARAIVRLINNDADTSTSVIVDSFSIVSNDSRTGIPQGEADVGNSHRPFGVASVGGDPVNPWVSKPGSSSTGASELQHPSTDLKAEQEAGASGTTVEWIKDSYLVQPESKNVLTTPSVMDLNSDGLPEIIYATYSNANVGNVLRAVSGDGTELWSVTRSDGFRANWAGQTAVGDIDNDGHPEIVAIETGRSFGHNTDSPWLVALEHDGRIKWKSPRIWGGAGTGAPALADIDADGNVEIIIGGSVLNGADGTLRWEGHEGGGSGRGSAGFGGVSIAADIDLDGQQEILAGKTAYDTDGSVLWELDGSDGFNAVGNFDSDLYPEIVFVSNGTVRILNHDGSEFLASVSIPGGGRGGPPTVADFDNDGEPEFSTAGANQYVVFETDGTVLWQATTQDVSSNITGSSVFDFDGNGTAEVVYGDERHLRIYNGTDGEVLFEFERSSSTGVELPVVADVDGDGATEIVFGSGKDSRFPTNGVESGLIVLGNADWVPTRPIWNQHSYHITNINDDGTIPHQELNAWEIYNNYRRNIQPTGTQLGLPEIQVFDSNTSHRIGKQVVLSGLASASGDRANGQPNFIETVTVNGQFVDVLDVAGRFYAAITIGPGDNKLRFEATDSIGQTVTTELTLRGTSVDESLDLASFEDSTVSFGHIYGRTSYSEQSDFLFAELATRNDGSFVVDVPLLVGVRNISSPAVSLVGFDGRMPDGTPYYDFTKYVESGALEPNETSRAPAFAFHNPNSEQFDYELVFFSQANRAPEFVTSPTVEAYSSRGYVYDAEAVDSEGQSLTYSLPNAPNAMQIDMNTGEIIWTPTVAELGRHSVTVAASDSRGAKTEQTFTLTVNEPPPNRPPIITNLPPTLANVATVFTEREVAIDLRNWSELAIIEHETLPAIWDISDDGLSVKQQTNTWPAVLVSDFEVTNNRIRGAWRVEDTGAGLGGRRDDDFIGFVFGFQDESHFYVFDWKRSAQQVPGFTAQRGMTVKVVESDTDLELGELWSSTGVGDRIRTLFPANDIPWENFTEYGFDLTFNEGRFKIVVTAGDTVLETIEIVDSTYTNGSFGFYNNSQSEVVYEGFLRSTAPDFSYQHQVEAFDPDGDEVSFELLLSPSGMAIDSQTGQITWGPDASQTGNHDVEVQVNDSHGNLAIQRFVVCVHDPSIQQSIDGILGTAPVITSEPITSAYVGQTWSYPLSVQDADSDFVGFRLDNGPEGMDIVTVVSGSHSGQLTQEQHFLNWSIPESAGDMQSSVELVVVDEAGNETRKSFALSTTSIAPENISPRIVSRPRFTATLSREWAYRAEAVDANGDELSYSLIDAPEGMTIDPLGVVRWHVPPTAPNEVNVIIEVADRRGLPTIQEFSLNIESNVSNSAPVISSLPPQRAVTGAIYRYTSEARDLDNDSVTWALDSMPSGMSIDSGTGEIRWMPTESQYGTHIVTVSAFDPFGGRDKQTFEVAVGCSNLAPLIVSVPPTNAVSNRSYVYAPRAFDGEGDQLNWSLEDGPAGMRVDAASGLIRWVPSLGQLGTHEVSVSVSDGEQVGTQDFKIVVLSADEPVDPNDSSKGTKGNRAPVILSTPLHLAEVAAVYRYSVVALDPDGDTLEFALAGDLPIGITIDADGLITWTPDESHVGENTVVVTATDTFGAVAAQGYTLTTTLNGPPEITSTPVTSVVAGTNYRYLLKASDPDGDPLRYELEIAPEGMSIDNRGRISWQSPPLSMQNEPVTVDVTDNRGQATKQNWTISPAADDVQPYVGIILSSAGDIIFGDPKVDIGSAYSVRVFASDNVGIDRISLYVDGEATSLDADYSVSQTAAEIGDVLFRAEATDPAGNVRDIELVVKVVDPAVANTPDPLDSTLPKPPTRHTNPTNERPIVTITSPEGASTVSDHVPIIGTVDDPEDNLWYYRVYYARADKVSLIDLDHKDPDWVIIKQSTEEVIEGELAVFDPSLLGNDPYAILVAGFDAHGRGYIQPTVLYVEGNVQVGNFQLDSTDLTIPVAGIPIEITRVYDTLHADYEGDFGYGWTLGVQDAQILEVAAVGEGGAFRPGRDKFYPDATKVYLTNPSGQRVGYTYKEELVSVSFFGGIWRPYFEPDPGVYDTLSIDETRVARGGLIGSLSQGINPDAYTLTTREGLEYRYHQDHGLETISDLNANVVTFSDEGVHHSSGQSIDFVRDFRGRIDQIIDPSGNVIDYQYDAFGDLTSVTNQEGLTTRYRYLSAPDQPSHYLYEAFDALNQRVLKAVYEEDPQTNQFVFKGVIDAAGNRIDDRDFDTVANTGVIRDANGNATTLIYDDRGNVLEEIDAVGNKTVREYGDPRNPDLETRIVDRNGHVVQREHDAQGNLLKITEHSSAQNVAPNETAFTYDSGNRVTSIKNALGALTAFQYDSRGNLTRITNAEGNSSEFTYDPEGRRASFVDFNRNVTRFEYNNSCPCGLPSKAIYADGTHQTFQYNQYGQVTLEETFEADDTPVLLKETRYDRLGRIIEERTGAGIDPNHAPTLVRKAYDGHLLDWEIIVHPDSLDASGNLLEFPSTPVDQRKSRITDYEYDINDRVIRQIDAEGGVVEFRYDANANRVLLQDPVGNITTWVYDGLNRAIEERDPFYNLGLTIDEALATLSVPSGADLSNDLGADHVQAFAFDGQGNQIEMVDRNGRRREFDYDQAGRMLAERWYATSTGELVETIAFSYDTLGNMLTASDSSSSYLYSYDTLNRLASVDNNPDDSRGVPRVILSYDYDAQGNVTLTEDDAGVTVESEYDARNRLAIRKWYDAQVSTGESADVEPARVDFIYNAAGRESEIRRYSDLSGETMVGRTSRTYDASGRSDALIHFDAVDSLIAGYDYDYDFSGLLLHESRSHQNAEYTQEIDYAYDLTGQLTDAVFSGQDDEHYAYDANGNRITSLIGPSDNPTDERTYATGPANQLDSDGIYRYEYDGEGNQTKRVHMETGETRTLIYDHHNRLVRVDDWSSDPGDPNNPAAGAVLTQTVEYTYDALGRRIARTADLDGSGPLQPETEFFIYNGDNVWADFDGSGQVIARYLFANGMDENLVSARSNSNWHLADRLGTSRDFSTKDGRWIQRAAVSTFGMVVPNATDSLPSRYLYTGREFDHLIDRFYFRARSYAPETGRFGSHDPMGLDAGDANFYRYVYNSPLNGTDPTGQIVLVEAVLIASALVTIGLFLFHIHQAAEEKRILDCVEQFNSLSTGAEAPVIATMCERYNTFTEVALAIEAAKNKANRRN